MTQRTQTILQKWWPKLEGVLAMEMVLLAAKQASEPSPKLIILATHTHGNDGGPQIAMLQLLADPGPSDDSKDTDYSAKMVAQIGGCLGNGNGTAGCQASLRTLSKAHHSCHTYPWQQWRTS